MRIFISHSSKDLDFVRGRLKKPLDDLGVLAWCSATDVNMGADWERQIRAALAQSDWFVVVLSPDAAKSEWVQAETHWALENLRGRVIPVMARGCDPGTVHLRLATLQYIDFRLDAAAATERLLELISGRVANLPGEAPTGSLEQSTVIVATRQASALFLVEPEASPAYEHRLEIRNSATIGRARDADLRLADDCVSRKHARISILRSETGKSLTIADLDSANGTFVNQERILAIRPLAVGDLIGIGNTRLSLRRID